MMEDIAQTPSRMLIRRHAARTIVLSVRARHWLTLALLTVWLVVASAK